MPQPVLKVEDLWVEYPARRGVVKAVNKIYVSLAHSDARHRRDARGVRRGPRRGRRPHRLTAPEFHSIATPMVAMQDRASAPRWS